MSIVQYQVRPFLRGFSTSIFTFGASGSGKDTIIAGTKKEPGLLLLFAVQVLLVLLLVIIGYLIAFAIFI